jgi:predicted nucleic acid-binding protein
MRVFLDTVGLVAVWNHLDQWHDAASRAYTDMAQMGSDYLTTTFVLLECGNTAARQPFRKDAILLRESLEAEGRLVFPTQDDWQSAWAAYRRGEADQAGIVDQVSFAVMRRLGLTHAFTNDKHFRAAGFTTLF